MTAPKTWILIGDAAHARVLAVTGTARRLVAVPAMTLQTELPMARELGSERPSRTHDSVGPGRHAVEAKSNPRRVLQRKFAQSIADRLDRSVTAKEFDRLLVVMAPAMLGDLRQCLSKAVLDRVVAEVAKDLVKVPDNEIRSHLDGIVAF